MQNVFSPRSKALLSPPHRLLIEPVVRNALLEDIGHGGDITTEALVDPQLRATGNMVARTDGIIAGLEAARVTFELLDPLATFSIHIGDGEFAAAGQRVASVHCTARALLTGERTALNIAGRLSGVATATRQLVDAVMPYRADVVCTRKTTAGLRVLEKYAVRCGGGKNHRFGLHDGILIKDNHLALCDSIAQAVAAVRERAGHMVKIEVEVDTLEQLQEVLAESAVDAVLLDNMSDQQLRDAVQLAAGRVLTEASGGITPQRIAQVAATGVDLISSGWITHSAPALDLALDVEG